MSNFRDLLKQNGQGVYSPSNKPTLDVLTGTAVNSAKLNNKTNSTAATAGTIAERDSAGDINVRLIRPNYSDQNTITGAMAFRVNNSTDNYVRFCNSKPAIRTYLETYSKTEADDRFLNKTTGKVADSDKLDGLDSGSFLRSDADDLFSGDLVSSTRNKGLFGAYYSTKIDHIWSMGTAYRIDANGDNFGNLYGLAYKHTNNPTGGAMAGGHQMVWCTNGVPQAALGDDGIWTSGAVLANSHVNSNHSFRFNSKIAIGGTNDTWLRLNPNDDFTSGVVINGKVVTSSPQGADVNALTRKDYVDGNFIKKSGGTFTGAVTFNSEIIHAGSTGTLLSVLNKPNGYAGYFNFGGGNDWLKVTKGATSAENVVSFFGHVGGGKLPTQAQHLTRKDYVDNTFVKKAGDVMTGRLDVTSPPKSTNIADTFGYAKIRMDLASTGGTAGTYFYPLTSQRARHDQGYVTHVTTGLVKNGYGSSWGEGVSGYFVGVGGNDGHPTEYFTMAYGGKIKHSRGHEFYSTAFKPTAADVGAMASGSAYTKAESDGRFLGINAKAYSAGILEALDARSVKPDSTGISENTKGVKPFFVHTSNVGTGSSGYADLLVLDTYSDSSGGRPNALAFNKLNKKIYHLQPDFGGTSWGTAHALYSEANKPTAADVGALPTTGGILTGKVTAVGSGITYTSGAFEARGNGNPSQTTAHIGFHQPGHYAGSLALVADNSFEFRNGPGNGLGNVKALKFNASGTVAGEGLAFNGKTAIGGINDAWLRINPHTQFASGVYCGATGVLRHDNEIQANAWIGGNRATRLKATHSDTSWSTNGAAAVSVNNPDSSGAHWLLASYYDGNNIRSGIQVHSSSAGAMRLYTDRRSKYVEINAGNVFVSSSQVDATNALTRKDYVDSKVSGVTANGVKINLPAPSTSNPAIHIKYGPQGDDYGATTLLQWNEKPVVHTSTGGFGRPVINLGDSYSYNHLITRSGVQIESSDGTGGMVACYYSGQDNKETNFPVGSIVVAWVGIGYYQSKTNQTTTMYVVTDSEGYPRYGTAWYNAHSSGVAVAGTWAYRGYVGSLGGVQLGLMQRIG
ncbi:hypothetical protein OS347_000760 [Vibrio vulnificus]|nr:hypothetical protein [Vibrio vulnificus]